MRLTIAPGTLDDYRRLAAWHYRGASPAVIVRILTARLARNPDLRDDPAGVLVVTMPVLNGPWRARAWPGTFTLGPPRRRARALGGPRGVRTIARVVVDPRCRGLGIARRLVAAYLRAPLTPHTEALAAMGALCPIFTRAGMTDLGMLTSRRDVALRRALAAAGLHEADLCCPALVIHRLRLLRARRGAHAQAARALVHALGVWARRGRATCRAARARRPPTTRALIEMAATSLGARRHVFVFPPPHAPLPTEPPHAHAHQGDEADPRRQAQDQVQVQVQAQVQVQVQAPRPDRARAERATA